MKAAFGDRVRGSPTKSVVLELGIKGSVIATNRELETHANIQLIYLLNLVNMRGDKSINIKTLNACDK